MDGPCCYPVASDHRIIEGRPTYYVGDVLKMQGQKGVGTETWQDEIAFNTGVLRKPDARRLRTPVPGPNDGPRLSRDEVKYTDLDKVWEIMVVAGPCLARGMTTLLICGDCASRIYQPSGVPSHAGYLSRYQDVIRSFTTAPQAVLDGAVS